jgi:hypothetical protein
MKTIIGIFIVLISFATTSQAQNNFISNHMNKYMNDDSFTSLNFSMSGSLAKSILEDIQKDMEGVDGKFMDLIKNLSQMNLLTTEKQAKKHYTSVLEIMKKENYKPLMTLKEGKSTGVNIMAREGKEGIEEVLLLVNDDDDFVLICFSGAK